MERTLVKHAIGNTGGQFDQQMSLQLYGALQTNPQNVISTQASTVPTQGRNKPQIKGKKITSQIKGI